MSMAKERADDTNLQFYGTFDETAIHVLDESVNDNMRIFILISDEIRTRNTLCEVMIIIGAGSLTNLKHLVSPESANVVLYNGHP